MKKQIIPFISLMWRKGKFPVDKRKQLYFAFVQSHLTCMLPIYGECPKYKIAELQVIQNRCIKAMYRLERSTHTSYLFSTSLMPVAILAKTERITFAHKLICNLTKNNFTFITNGEVHNRTTRRNSRIHIYNPNSNKSTSLNTTNAT